MQMPANTMCVSPTTYIAKLLDEVDNFHIDVVALSQENVVNKRSCSLIKNALDIVTVPTQELPGFIGAECLLYG